MPSALARSHDHPERTKITPQMAPPHQPSTAECDDEPLRNLAVTLAHRLRSLVTSIEAYTDLLTDTLGTRDQREMAQRIFKGAASIEHVLMELQLFSQSIDPIFRGLEPRDLVDGALAALPEEDLLRIQPTIPVSTAAIRGDAVLLRQALLILVRNALEASLADGPVRIAFRPEGGELHVDVWNAGAIYLKDAEKIVFEPFFTTKASNLGIGLAIARRIADAHQGALYLRTNDAIAGTCFTLTLKAY